MKKEITRYIKSIGGNDADVEQILEEVEANGYNTMEQVMAHIDNYY